MFSEDIVYIKGNILHHSTAGASKALYEPQAMLPFVGRIEELDAYNLSMEDMARYLNIKPDGKVFKLWIHVDGEGFPAVLTERWNVCSTNPKAIAVIRWKIEDFKRRRLEMLERIEERNEAIKQERLIYELHEDALIEHASKRTQKTVPLLWGDDFDTAVSARVLQPQ